ncbi:MAG: OmpA family protein [Polyangiaceae bacterium]|jgi:chemotaxis protein MotB
MRNRRALLSDTEGIKEVWPSFTDVMSTMALILFVLVLLAYVRNLNSSKRLAAFQRQVSKSEQQLRALRTDIDIGRSQLAASQGQLRDQQAIIADSNRQLGDLRSQLQSMAVLRVEVLSKLKHAIEEELGPANDAGAALVTIGDNGNIIINESLVFEYDSFSIKQQAKPVLDTLARALGHALADDSVRSNIDTILIQGHTDKRGSVSFNWDLSAKRATTVLDYLFESNKTLADVYGGYFAAAAYSKFRPIDGADSESAYQRNRRIEISIVPKDATMRQVIDAYVQSINPTLGRSPTNP